MSLFCINTLLTAAAPSIPSAKPTKKIIALTTQQRAFVNTLLPKIDVVNSRISSDRNHLLSLNQQVKEQTPLSQKETLWLTQLAKRYNIKAPSGVDQPALLGKLLNRVNTVPAPLVIAQAANESAWGRSRFAKEGNNYFGQWCTRPGCGLIPRQRPAGKTYEVRRFGSAEASVASYIHNLNTHRAYRTLRAIRSNQQRSGLPFNSLELAKGLSAYSAHGDAYIRMIRNIIINYQLAELVNRGHA